jgi:DNA-binding transcriptional MerR regulator
MLARSPQPPRSAYKTIGEVAAQLDLPIHVLRFWEARFDEVRPLRRGSGDSAKRLYRAEDIALLNGIRVLLHAEGYSIRGVQRILREKGAQAVRDAVPAN